MAKQTKIGLWLAAVVMVIVALWAWRRTADDESASSQGQASADASSQSASGSRPRPVGARLDLIGAPKATVSGTIRELGGQPIADAQVCAISSYADRLGLDDRKPHCVRSGADGRYRIESLLPIKTEIHASAATFKPNRWQRRELGVTRTHVTLRAGQTVDGIDVTLAPGGVLITGVVKDIAGGEIEGAQVSISGGFNSQERGSAIGQSGPEGRFELWGPPGSIEVAATTEGYADGEVWAVAPGEFIELFLTPESVLVGKVVRADSGAPVEGAVISTHGYSWGAGGDARTDEHGRFRIDRLQPGTYKPSAETEELYGQVAEQVHLGLGQTSDEVVIRLHPAVFIEGTVVVAGADRPCSSGWVELEKDGLSSERATIDEEGHVEFRGVLAGEYQVHVRCNGHVSQDEYDDLVVGSESLGGLIWEVREGLAIRGEVVDEAGQPLAQLDVRAQMVVDPEAARTQTTSASRPSESDGSFELAGLLPGRYEVFVGGWRGRPGPIEPTVVELDGGADVNDVRIVMPGVGTIRGRVIDETGKPVSGANLEASLLVGQGRGSARSNDAGEFTIEDLRPGQTRVTAGSGEAWWSGTAMRKPGTTDDDLQGELVEVVANEVVEVTLTVESRDGRITGVVKDEGGGPVADAFIDIERMSDKAGASQAWTRRGVRWSWGTKPVLTDADGRFELDGLPDGKFIVRASRKGGGEALLEDVALGSHIELTIASTGEMSGTVTLAGGGVPERFTVSLEDKAAGIHAGDTFFRTDGVWRLREIPAGKFEIVATASQGTVTLETPVELSEGERRTGVELVLEPRVTVRGRIVDLETGEPVAGLEVHVTGGNSFSIRNGGGDHRNVTGPDGRFEIEDAPAGKANLMAWSRAGGSKAKYEWLWKPLTIASEPLEQDIGDVEVVAKRLEPKQKAGDLGFALNEHDPTIEPADWQAIVASVRPGGPADAAGLAAGDVIEKVAGHDIRGTNSSRYHGLTQVPEGAAVKLELSDGKTIEIIAGPSVQ